jgi:hypothetical protein
MGETTMPVAYSIRRRGGRSIGRERRERARHRDHDRIHDRGHCGIVENGHAAHLAVLGVGAHVELPRALQAGQHEEIRPQHAVVRLPVGRFLLLLLERGGERGARPGHPKRFDLHLAARCGQA